MDRRTFVGAGAAAGLLGLSPTARMRPRAARVPGEPLRLNFNENPLGLAPAARRAVIDAIPEGNRYPGPARRDLEAAIARLLDLTPDHLVVGAGSTDVLRMAVQATAGPGARFVTADPTFEDIAGYGARFAVPVTAVPLAADGAHDLPAMRRAADGASGPVLVFLCNPNNPTGTLTPSAAIDAWIANAPARVRFVVDEAYYEYVEDGRYHTALPWTARRQDVVVIRTFSKIYGMAGMRVGYGVAHPETAAALRRHQGRNNVSWVTAAAALASLRDRDLIPRARAANRAARDVLTDTLTALAIPFLPSHANFVMHRVKGDLETYIDRMRAHDVLVGRPFPPLLDHNRVSLGTPEEMEQFCGILREFREKGWI